MSQIPTAHLDKDHYMNPNNSPDSEKECSVCNGNGFIDVEKYDRVEQCDCGFCGGTGFVKD